MQEFAYPARFKPPDDEGRILVTFRDFSYGATDGANRSEAMTEAIDLLESLLAHCVHRGEQVPRPSSPRRGEVLVRPSAITAAQVALYSAMRSQRISPAMLAKRLGRPVREIRSLIDLANYPPIEAIERALAALGHRLTVALDAAE